MVSPNPLLLALTFGLYSLMKKQASHVNPLVGLTVETSWIAPIAFGYLVWLQASGASTLFSVSPINTVGLFSAGVVTAIPLLLFAAASRRVSLTTIGLLQYSCPVIQFILGMAFGEDMPLPRWIGFGLVWLALVILSVDLVRASRQQSRLRV